MKSRKPDTFVTSNTPDTTAEGVYSTPGTQVGSNQIGSLLYKTEISHVKELFEVKLKVIEDKVKDINDSLSGREVRFWIIVGVLIAAIISIFLYALPEIYRHDYAERYQKTIESIEKVDERVKVIEKGVNINQTQQTTSNTKSTP